MKNNIVYVDKEEAEKIKTNFLNCQNVFLAEVDGSNINSEEEFVLQMSRAFMFPHELQWLKLGWFVDYIRDLMWIDENKEIVLLIDNFERMLLDDKKLKKRIIHEFVEIILPWWEEDVIGHMVGGKTRKFMVYLEVNKHI